MDRQAYFHQLNLKRAKARKHRHCPVHKKPRRVCEVCTRTYCPACNTHLCVRVSAPTKTPMVAFSPPRAWKPLWKLVQPMGAFRIDVHPDAGALKVLFPPNALNVSSAGELADKVWANESLNAIAIATPFRAGRGTKPSHWWVSVQLKEKP